MLDPELQAKADAYEKQLRQKLCIWIALEHLFYICIIIMNINDHKFRFHQGNFFTLIMPYVIIILILLILPVLALQSKIIYRIIEGFHAVVGAVCCLTIYGIPLGLLIMLRYLIYEFPYKFHIRKKIKKATEDENPPR